MQQELQRNQDEMADMEKSWQQKMQEREKEFEVKLLVEFCYN